MPAACCISNELLYNFQAVCRALIQQDAWHAGSLFASRLEVIFNEGNDAVSEDICRQVLQRLNQSIYHFILFHWKLSLHTLCQTFEAFSFQARCREDLQREVQEMLCAYCNELSRYGCTNSYITRAAEYIEHNIHGDLSLPRVASHVFVCSAYLSELFPACTGQKFCEYVAHRRVERAKDLLCTTKMTVQEISQQCGFGSSSYFSCVFSKHTGLSPRAYRSVHSTDANEAQQLLKPN